MKMKMGALALMAVILSTNLLVLGCGRREQSQAQGASEAAGPARSSTVSIEYCGS